MKVETQIQHICKLILRSMHTRLSEEEYRELEAWRKMAPRNEEVYRRLVERDFTSEEYSRYRQVRQTDDWGEVQKKIRSRRRHFLAFEKWRHYAAVLVVGFIALFFWKYQEENRQQEPDVVIGQDILPGSTQAILELESREQIRLGQNERMDTGRLDSLGVVANTMSLAYVNQDSSTLEYHVLRIPRGGEYILILSDGTKVWINSESVLRYPNHFVGDERRVQVEGEAYFQVAKDASKPFIVEAAEMDIRVTGTEFNVMAYQDKDRVETTLVKGSIEVDVEGKVVKMLPDMQAVFSKTDKQLTTRNVRAELYTSWKEGIFEFRDLPLREIAEQLGRWYDVEFEFRDELVAEIRFTGAVKRMKPITFILDVIKETKAINYRIDGKTVIVKKK